MAFFSFSFWHHHSLSFIKHGQSTLCFNKINSALFGFIKKWIAGRRQVCLNYQTIPFFYKNVLQEKRQRQGGRQCFNIFSSLLLMELPTLLTLFSYAALNIFFFLSKSGFQELQISKILLSSILLSFLFFFFLHPNLCRKGSLPLTLLQEWTWSKAVECKCNSTSTSGFVCHEFYTTNVQGRKGWQFYTVSVPNDDVYEYFDLLLSRGYYKLL